MRQKMLAHLACLAALLAEVDRLSAAPAPVASQPAAIAQLVGDRARPGPAGLVTGRMFPAFDHLGGIGDQLDAALAAGCNLIYASGIGAYGYSGLPPRSVMDANLARLSAYNRKAHAGGVRLMLSYLCATSIVHIDKFAANWDEYFPNRPPEFTPQRMLQQDIDGLNLPSWYGADYSPADLSNPYWRQYTKLTIKLAVESGHDGAFFDNPTVHPNGNYSVYAMAAWARFLERQGVSVPKGDVVALRALTRSQAEWWRRFRATEAADFLGEMRDYGRSLKPDFVLTANNSLNSWDSFYSQPQTHGYSIPQQCRYEDIVTIEDMSSQPRRKDSAYFSYGSTLRMLHAVSGGRPLSICTVDGDYTAPPDLIGLSIAECAAHDAAYIVWACWQPEFRDGFAADIARYHRFLNQNAELFVGSSPVSELLLIWPYENWVRMKDCVTARLARELTARNIQYEVVTEADLRAQRLKAHRVMAYAAGEGLASPATQQLLVDYRQRGGMVVPIESSQHSMSLQPLDRAIGQPFLAVENQQGVRGVVRKTRGGGYVLHLYNLDVQRVDSYHDRVTPAENMRISWTLPRGAPAVSRARLLTPDAGASGSQECRITSVNGRIRLDFVIPTLRIWAVVTLE